jgi:hypothetical protein
MSNLLKQINNNCSPKKTPGWRAPHFGALAKRAKFFSERRASLNGRLNNR